MQSCMKEKISRGGIWKIVKAAFKKFGEYKIPKLSGSLAYYTVFSMAPLLVLLVSLSGIFLGEEAAQGKIYSTLSSFLGTTAASELQDIIRNASLTGKSNWAAVIGGFTLLIGATTVFGEIQDSINSIWGVKAKPRKKGWLRLIKNRVLSFSIVATLGFLLLVSLVISALIDALGQQLQANFPNIAIVVFYMINTMLTVIITTILFGVIFRVLPDTETPWKDVWGGAFATAVLFMIGKGIIALYISKAGIGETYGAAGSLVILLVWVYYSAMILYLGAAITKEWAIRFGSGIHPDRDAATIRVVEVETGSDYKKNKSQR